MHRPGDGATPTESGNPQPIVLATLAHYLPGYKLGGPVRSLANLVERLSNDFRFKIITSDRDEGDLAPYADVPIDVWTTVGRADVFYASPAVRSISGFRQLMTATPYDVLYLNSLFEPAFSILPLALRRSGRIPYRPVVLAPRGEFAPSALAIKAAKKRTFLATARLTGLHRDLVWQASTPIEAEAIRCYTGAGAPILVARDLIADLPCSGPSAPRGRVKPEGKLKIAFLGRITPMKNLTGALEILQTAGPGEITFDIYGPIDDPAYWAECEARIRALPPHVMATHRGPLAPDQVATTLATHDLFFLPTLGENFGHVILEAMAAGLPVLISDRTPWRGLEAAGVGFDLPLEHPEAFRAAIGRMIPMGPAAFAAWSDRVRAFAAATVADSEALEHNRALFRHALLGR